MPPRRGAVDLGGFLRTAPPADAAPAALPVAPAVPAAAPPPAPVAPPLAPAVPAAPPTRLPPPAPGVAAGRAPPPADAVGPAARAAPAYAPSAPPRAAEPAAPAAARRSAGVKWQVQLPAELAARARVHLLKLRRAGREVPAELSGLAALLLDRWLAGGLAVADGLPLRWPGDVATSGLHLRVPEHLKLDVEIRLLETTGGTPGPVLAALVAGWLAENPVDA